MKNLFLILMLALIHGAPSCSMAQTTPNTQTIFEGIDSKQNYIKNPYARLSDLNVSCTNATKSRDATTDKLYGAASFSIDASAQNGFCEFALKPILGPDDSGNCEFKGVFKGDGTLYRAQILDGSGLEKNKTAVLGNSDAFGTGKWGFFSVNFPCQSTPKVRITQTEAGTAPAIKVGAYYGRATNLGQGTSPNTFTAVVSSTGVASNQTPYAWITGSCGPSSAGNFQCPTNVFAQTPNCNVTVNTAGGSGLIGGYLRSSSTSTSLYFITTSGGTAASNDFTVTCTKTGADFVQPAITAQNFNFDWVNITSSFATPQGLGTITSGFFEGKRDGGDLLIRGRGVAGTVNGSEIRFTLPFGLKSKAAFPAGNATQTCGRILRNISATTAGNSTCLIDQNSTYFRVGTGDTGSATILTPAPGTTVFNSGDAFSLDLLRIPIEGWTETMNAPQLLGSVTSNSQNALRFEYAYVVCSASASVSQPSSTGWVSIANISSNRCALTFSGFSAPPICISNADTVATSTLVSAHVSVASSTSGSIGAVTQSGGTTSASSSSGYFLTCIGPR